MFDYEELILARQETEADDCKGCKHLEECRNGTRSGCICNEVIECEPFSWLPTIKGV